ncbi:tumor necrosis factor receptor superfamily member 6 [Pagrus major]|uniref:tumor necrosis factor receptor superfamily member 6 n=1 Tax=Pagrus major TaxID=143350 RepID=UPI003CC876C4
MAAHVNRCPARITTAVLFSLLVSVVSSSQCIDGTYDHDGMQCCKCGIGLYVETHCTANLEFGQCVPCPAETFSSHPTGLTSCEPCTSCSHDIANLEEEVTCTSARNRKCRCKKDHYCASGTDICTLCQSCAKCPEGIKVPCTGNNNTVCNERGKETEGGDQTGKIVGIIFGILLIAAVGVGVGVAVWFYCKRQGQNTLSQLPNGHVENPGPELELVEIRPLTEIPDMDLQPYLSDIAEEIGWPDMKDIAMRDKIPMTRIDNCERNHPHNTHEQTMELLQDWVQGQGLAAGKKLVQNLEKYGRQLKADKVKAILLRG